MQLELAKKIVNACYSQGKDARLYEDYSGRWMYGEGTTGVVVDSKDTIINAVINNPDDFKEFDSNKLCSESLGYDTVVY